MRLPNALALLAISTLSLHVSASPLTAPVRAPSAQTAAQPGATSATAPVGKSIAPADDISAPPRGAPAKPANGSAAPAAKSPAAAPLSAGPDRLLWDHWYTVMVNKVVHYEYYNDRAEIKKGRIVFQNHAWKQEEDYINEEQLGAFANNDAALTPLFFNFHSSYRSVETNIDGSIAEQNGGGRMLSVRIRKGSNELPLVKKMVSPKTLLSLHFPIWLGRNLASFKPGQVYPFQTILEDNLEAEFSTVGGQVRVEPADSIATSTHTTKITVNYHEMKSLWWVDANGAPARIEMPLQKTLVQRVSKEAAQKFLDESG